MPRLGSRPALGLHEALARRERRCGYGHGHRAVRCAVVANGRAFYEEVLKNPREMPKDLTFEPLLYVAMTAYKRKIGKEFMILPAFNYETYSNKEGWKNKNL